jgi:CoA:oxalate CoA-transferase
VRPLEGIRVLDFSRVLAGPHCGRALADLGADVVKIEPPDGDLTRFFTPRRRSMSLYFAQQNAGKRNISLDLSRPESTELLLRLVTTADVVLENFRPGVMAKMGLGYADVAAVNERCVYASISGYGQDGPWRSRRAYAPVIHAEMGMIAGRRQTIEGAGNDPYSHADVYSGIECTSGILAALLQRERTGRGQHVDVAMAGVLVHVNEHVHNELDDRANDRSVAPLFETNEGHPVITSVHPADPGAFELLVKAMGRPELLEDARFASWDARREHRDEVVEEVQRWVLGFDDLDDLEAALATVRIPLGVVRSVAEVAETAWAKERGVFAEVSDRSGGTIRIPSSPWRFSDAPDVGVAGDPAFRGEHNRAVFAELGLADDELDRLEADGVLSSRPPKP